MKTTEILEKLLEEEMLSALENQDWKRYDIAILKYAGIKAEQLKNKITMPSYRNYSLKARRTTDNGGIF